MIEAQQILDSYGITETSSQGIKRQADGLAPEKRKELCDEVAIGLMGMSYRIGHHAYEGGPKAEGKDLYGQSMALKMLLELLEPNHPFGKKP